VGGKTGLYKIGDSVRRLSPRECARLTGFPDEFKLHPSPHQCYRQFGNCLVVNVVSSILEEAVGQGFFR
jgi:DNA (cytosine-5)-methyltransferase 1